MYQDISDDKRVLDAIEGTLSTGHAEQAASAYEEIDDPEEYNPNALREIVDYLEGYWSDDDDAGEIVEFSEYVLGKYYPED
jgi:hypothetical protein